MLSRYRRPILLGGLLTNALLWALTTEAQVQEGASIVKELVGVSPSLGFAGLIIALVLIFVYLDGKNHREERDKWIEAMAHQAEATTEQTRVLERLNSSVEHLEQVILRSTG